jgi:hypothetical protein
LTGPLKNNIIVECGRNSTIDLDGIAFWVKNEPKITRIAIENNLIYNSNLTRIVNYKGMALSVEDFNQLSVDNNMIRNNIQLDPRFADPQNHDFHPRKGSPAIDAGIDVNLNKDFDRIPIPQGKQVDIGAFEYY